MHYDKMKPCYTCPVAEVPEESNISAKTCERVQQKKFAVEIPDDPIIHHLELNGSMLVQVQPDNLEHVGEVPLQHEKAGRSDREPHRDGY